MTQDSSRRYSGRGFALLLCVLGFVASTQHAEAQVDTARIALILRASATRSRITNLEEAFRTGSSKELGADSLRKLLAGAVDGLTTSASGVITRRGLTLRASSSRTDSIDAFSEKYVLKVDSISQLAIRDLDCTDRDKPRLLSARVIAVCQVVLAGMQFAEDKNALLVDRMATLLVHLDSMKRASDSIAAAIRDSVRVSKALQDALRDRDRWKAEYLRVCLEAHSSACVEQEAVAVDVQTSILFAALTRWLDSAVVCESCAPPRRSDVEILAGRNGTGGIVAGFGGRVQGPVGESRLFVTLRQRVAEEHLVHGVELGAGRLVNAFGTSFELMAGVTWEERWTETPCEGNRAAYCYLAVGVRVPITGRVSLSTMVSGSYRAAVALGIGISERRGNRAGGERDRRGSAK